MAYSQTLVAVGGIAHVPVVIAILKFIEKRFSINSNKNTKA